MLQRSGKIEERLKKILEKRDSQKLLAESPIKYLTDLKVMGNQDSVKAYPESFTAARTTKLIHSTWNREQMTLYMPFLKHLHLSKLHVSILGSS